MSFSKLTIRDVPLDNQTVLVRVDYNVPLVDGKVGNDFRMRASLPTLRYLLARRCRIVLISHLGRPKGVEMSLSLEPIARHLEKIIDYPVTFVDATIGDKVYQSVKRASSGDIIMLENLRFHPEEENNGEEFAKKLVASTKAKYFVQDGFSVVHRAHASTDAITLLLPSVAGLLLEKESQAIDALTLSPKEPVVAIIGGAKVADKLPLIKKLATKADKIILGGAIANTFLFQQGIRMGASVMDADMADEVAQVYEEVGESKIVLPVDVAVGHSIKPERKVVGLGEIGIEDKVMDIGDRSIEKMAEIVGDAKTVFWNGTLGVAETPAFAHGSARLALTLATKPSTKSIIGGGETAEFVLGWDAKNGDSFDHVSTGGGAFLEMLVGNELPGLDGLLDARK